MMVFELGKDKQAWLDKLPASADALNCPDVLLFGNDRAIGWDATKPRDLDICLDILDVFVFTPRLECIVRQ